MAQAGSEAPLAPPEVLDLDPRTLLLDRLNPRMPDALLADQDAALTYLAKYGALDEIVSSISSSKWIDFEPLIVLAHDDDLNEDNIVIEGNRRLAALLLLGNPQKAKELRVAVPAGSEGFVPTTVRAWVVQTRAQARNFIGFKHINGAYRWDSFAKAKFAADWFKDVPDIAAISKQLGDSHSTVLRLVNGYKVYRQAEDEGLARAPELGEKFAFSHLYVGLTRPGIRTFLGLEGGSGVLPDEPVQAEYRDELRELMGWLYGNDEARPVIKSQNPDLKQLATVLASARATTVLRERRDLRAAFDIVEDKSGLFTRELDRLWTASKAASSLLGHYDGNSDALERAEFASKTVIGLVAAMQTVQKPAEEA